MRYLEVGTILYHKTQKIKCIVKGTDDKFIKVIMDEPIDGKSELVIPKYNMGIYLFWSTDEMKFSVEELASTGGYEFNKDVKLFLEKERLKEKEFIKGIDNVITSRGIKYLTHFTSLENINSILDHGILSREKMGSLNIKYIFNDNKRMDYKLNCTSFSVEHPNINLLNKFKANRVDDVFVVILIDAEVLKDYKQKKYFCYNNAARADIVYETSCDNLITPADFENMFSPIDYYSRNGITNCKHRDTMKYLKKYLTTDFQAEILIEGIIYTKFIEGIYFECNKDFIESRKIIRKEYLNKYRYKVNKDLFTKREEVKFKDRGNECG